MEAVKTDTFLRAQADKSNDPVAMAALAYVEAAGDETNNVRKLQRHLRSALAKFATQMAEFVDPESNSANSINYTLTDESNDITMTIIVTDRYNSALAKPLSSLAEDYIVYMMDGQWWQQFKSELSKDYFGQANEALNFIRLCLAKTAPAASPASYNDVTGTVTNN